MLIRYQFLFPDLDQARRAAGGPVRTKDTAIARQRPEESGAAGAFVEINAHIGWHYFLRLITAFGTRQNGDICFGHNVR